jgi:predicted small secreted protein
MKAIGRILAILVLALGLTIPLTGCEENGAEDMGEEMEEAGEDLEEAAEDAQDDMEDAAEEAGDELEEATD